MSAVVHPPLVDQLAAEAVGITKTYGHGATAVQALKEVTFAVPTGRFTAIMGPSGSGKSTLMHCMAGLDGVDGGTIRIGDVELSTLSDRERTILRREAVGFVFQAFNLIPSLTAMENITLPLRLAGREPEQAWLGQLVATMGLGERLHHTPAELSGGQQQRVAVARALVSRPSIVFADEPTGNLDSTTSAELLAFLQRAARELGQTIVMVTHDPVAASYSDRVVFLADGRIVDELAAPTVDAVLDRIRRLEA